MGNLENVKKDLTGCMDVKTYASHAGKSDVAAYRQIKRDKYKPLWEEGHIFNQDGKTYLDSTAITELDVTRTFVTKDDTYEIKYRTAKQELEKQKEYYENEIKHIREESEKRFASMQETLEHMKSIDSKMDLIMGEKETKLLLDKKSEELSDYINKVFELTCETADMQVKICDLENELENEKKKSWWQKLLGR